MPKKFLFGFIVILIVAGMGYTVRPKEQSIMEDNMPRGNECKVDEDCYPFCPQRNLYKSLEKAGIPAPGCDDNRKCDHGKCVNKMLIAS